MSVQNQYNDNGYKNWLRACLGLKYMKDGIIDFVDAEVRKLHTIIITNVCGSRSCSRCSTDYLTKRRHRCPNNVCDLIRQEIEQNHRFNRPCWQNTDATKWYTDYWEIGKCFTSHGNAQKSTAAETDCSGLLSICINGLFLPPTLTGQINTPCVPAVAPADIFHKNRETRNTLLHSGSMSVSDVERQAYIQDMVSLLTNYKQPIDHVTQNAISKLTQLNTNIFITSTDELGVLRTKLEAIGNMQTDVQTTISEIGELKTSTKGDIDALKTQMDCTQSVIQCTESDIGELKTQMDCTQSAIQCTESDIGELKTQMDCSQGTIRDTESKVGSLEAKIAKFDNKQSHLKHSIEQQGQQQKIDTCRVEAHIKNNADSLALVNDKLDKLHCNLGDGVTDMKTACEQLQAKHESQCNEIANLTLGIEVQGRSHEVRFGKVEDQVANLKLRIEVQDKSHEVRFGKVEDQVTEISKIIDATPETIRHGNTAQDKNQQIKDVEEYLVAKYKRDELTVPMSPLLRRISANVDDVYIELTLRDDLVHKPRDQMEDECRDNETDKHWGKKNQENILSYHDVLYAGNNSCKNIYVVGKAGVGKTTWSRKFVATWVRAMEHKGTYNVLNENETVLQEYDLVFYIALRHAQGDTHIMEMIEHQLFPHAQDLFAVAKTLINNTDDSSRCIIMLDGLDEWHSHENHMYSDGLPLRDPRWKTAIITTTRSWKLEALQLETGKIHRAVEIQGLRESGVKLLIAHVVSTLNNNTGTQKNAADFQSQINPLIQDCMKVPLLLTIFVCLWYENDEISKHLAGIYGGLVNLLIQYAEGNTKTRLFQRIVPQKLKEIKVKWKEQECSVPDCLPSNAMMVTYMPFLLRLGKLAFTTLFAESKEFTLVFNYQSIENVLFDGELDLSVNIGILSQTIQPGSALQQEFALSFLHKNVQEYLAALYMVCGDHKSECLNKYKTYCANAYRILEMENILLFLSGLCPEMAGEISCHIADMQADEAIHRLLLRCLREEHSLSNNSAHIYIKHHFWYKTNWYNAHAGMSGEYNKDTVSYLSTTTNKDTILHVSGIDDGSALSDFTHIEPIDMMYFESQDEDTSINLSGCKALRTLKYRSSSAPIQLPSESLENVIIEYFKTSTPFVLDLSACHSLRTLACMMCAVPLRLPNNLVEVTMELLSAKMEILDLSRCNVLIKLRYTTSSVPIALPTESLEEVVITNYTPNTELELDISRCTKLRTLEYRASSVPVIVPTESLEKVVIENYAPSIDSVLNLTRCTKLRTFQYKTSSVTVTVPTECLEEVVIENYSPNIDSLLNLTACTHLRTLEYKASSVPVMVPTKCLEEVVMENYTPSTESELDMSRCKTIRTLRYLWSSVPIVVPLEFLEDMAIEDCTVNARFMLHLAGDTNLRKLEYEAIVHPKPQTILEMGCTSRSKWLLDTFGCHTASPISQIDSFSKMILKAKTDDVAILAQSTCSNPLLDISESKSARTLDYRRSSVPLQIPVEYLTQVTIDGYNPSSSINDDPDDVLDMSGCKVLSKLSYNNSSVPIILPTECIEEVVITNYRPKTDSEFDISRCTKLRILEYKVSSVTVRVPTESLEKVVIEKYTPTVESVLNLTSCTQLRTLLYKTSSVPVTVPTDCLEEVVIENYTPSTGSVLDMSGCKTIRTLRYLWSSVPIVVPLEFLEDMAIEDCTVNARFMLHLAGDTNLRKLEYEAIVHPKPQTMLEMGCTSRSKWLLDTFGCHTASPISQMDSFSKMILKAKTDDVAILAQSTCSNSLLDISESKSARTLDYRRSSVPLQIPVEYLTQVTIDGYNPSSSINDDPDDVLDISGCKVLSKLSYTNSSVPIILPTECIEEVLITNYTPSTASVLDMSGCKTIRKLRYLWSSVPIVVPSEFLEDMAIEECTVNAKFLLTLAGDINLRKLEYGRIAHPKTQTMEIGYTSRSKWLLDTFGCHTVSSISQIDFSSKLILKEKTDDVAILVRSTCIESMVDISQSKSVKTLDYRRSSVSLQIPIEYLTTVTIDGYNSVSSINDDHSYVLDISGCNMLKTINYVNSSVPIILPTESLEEVVMVKYYPSTESVLDMSKCRVLRTLTYSESSVAIRLPTESLENVVMDEYRHSTEPVLDMSGCKILRKLEYTSSSIAIRLPTESLEEVEITVYRPSTESVLDMSGCTVLRKLEYTWSSVAIRLPIENLEEVVLYKYSPSTESVLDMSGYETLRKLTYTWSSIAIRLPTESLDEVEIMGYRPSTESVLDLSGCTVLRKLKYTSSSIAIRLPTESLDEVVMNDYSPSTESVLDLSWCKTLRTLTYKSSSIAIRLPTESLEEVVMNDYSPSTESVLDMSGCKVLMKLEYTSSSVAIRLPTESLEEVVMNYYSPSTESVLDMSGCKVLMKLEYTSSSVAIRLPTESLEEVVMARYSRSTESVLDMSGCKVLRKLEYKWSSIAILLPTESLEEIVMDGYSPSTGLVLDMSGCKVLRKLEYKWSSIAILLPTESLEEIVMKRYSPSTGSVLDMSGCKILRKLKYTSSSIAVRLPTESLEEVVMDGYSPSTESELDMSGCKVLRKLKYTSSSIAIRLPTESLEEVKIENYSPSTESVLNMSECKVLRKLEYNWSSIAILLPTEILEEVVMEKYSPSTESVLDMSRCTVLRKLKYTSSSVAIRLPTENLEEVVMDEYRPSTESLLDLSGCNALRTLEYHGPSTAIRIPNRELDCCEIEYYDADTDTDDSD